MPVPEPMPVPERMNVPEPMNVLVITLDQFRGDCLSLRNHPVVRTPNLDRLARRGVAFTRHYSQAAPCGPGRACLYTGTYQMTNRVVFNGTPLDDRLDNMARAARRAGYDPTLFGYTDQAVDPRTVTDPSDPRLRTYEGVLPGFDVALDLTHQRLAWNQWLDALGFEVHDDPDHMLATEPLRPAEVGISAFMTNQFTEWLDRQDDPWFAHLSHLRPHPPYAAAGHWSQAYHPDDVDLPVAASSERHHLHDLMLGIPDVAAPTDEGEMRRIRAQYYGMVADVDHELGRTLDALEERGLADSTVIVVTADHGDQLGDHGLLGKLGWHEESFHIPAIVSDPRRPGGHGTRCDLPTENVDLLPTLCELMDQQVPIQCEGRSLVPLLGGHDNGDPPGDSRGDANPDGENSIAGLWRTAATWEFDWRALTLIMGGRTNTADPHLLATMNLAVRRSSDTAYVQFGDGSWLCLALDADPTWRTPVLDPGRIAEATRDMLVWRGRHLNRSLTSVVFHGEPLGTMPEPHPA